MIKSNFWFIGEDGVRMRVVGADDIRNDDTEVHFMRDGKVLHTVSQGTRHGYSETTTSLD